MNNENYHDIDGKPCSLEKLCRTSPEWAANRIRALITQVSKAEEMAAELEIELKAANERIAVLEAELKAERFVIMTLINWKQKQDDDESRS